MNRTFKLASILVACASLALLAFWLGRKYASPPPLTPATAKGAPNVYVTKGRPVTNIYAHNLRLHQGPDFRVYIQWLRGQLVPTRALVTPSFDEPESFYLNVTNGVMRANLGDIDNYLNNRSAQAPLRDIRISGNGDQMKITGKLHKLKLTLPVELLGTVTPGGNNRLQMHVSKINVLKVPFKALLGGIHVTLSDIVGDTKVAGVQVTDNDLFFDPQILLPPPHIRGNVTHIRVDSPDMEAVYGDAKRDAEHVEQWRNFLRLQHGMLSFGKLTMQDSDLIMVDISQDPWFDLDLANYMEQLVNGYTRMTPAAGLQIFMPDYAEMKKGGSIEWIKNRNAAPPAGVTPTQ
jgi:hypothetical protein